METIKSITVFSENHALEFYKEEGDDKYKFRIVGDPDLTETILTQCKTKRVKEESIIYAARGIFETIDGIFETRAGIFETLADIFETRAAFLKSSPAQGKRKKEKPLPLRKYGQDDASWLNEICQAKFGKNIDCRFVSQTGAPHCPTIKVKVVLPDGKEAFGVGTSQKAARQVAAEKLLDVVLKEY